jgi:hypothetical protein
MALLYGRHSHHITTAFKTLYCLPAHGRTYDMYSTVQGTTLVELTSPSVDHYACTAKSSVSVADNEAEGTSQNCRRDGGGCDVKTEKWECNTCNSRPTSRLKCTVDREVSAIELRAGVKKKQNRNGEVAGAEQDHKGASE